MKLDNFRELLIKKSQDTSLQNLVRFMKEDFLADLVIESLEKMARSNHKGDAANFSVRDFGTEADPSHEPNMIHDALSHHASNYKAALNTGNQQLANQHAKQFFRIMDMADQAQKHSHGKLSVEAVSPHAWERNAKNETFGDKIDRLNATKQNGGALSEKDEEWLKDNPVTRGAKKTSQYINDTKAWRYRGNDFSFLQQAPHESYAQEIRRHGHNNAYPMEEVKVNGKYLDIEDVPSKGSYEAHPFDSHPVMSHFEEAAGKRTPQRDNEYIQARDKFQSSPELDQYFASQEARQNANPDAYSRRGLTKSPPVHKQVDPLDAQAQNDTPAQSASQVVKRPQPAPIKKQLSEEERKKILDSLPPELQEKLKRLL